MSDVDCLTAIDRAFRATLEAALVPGTVKRVLGPEDVGPDRPLPQRFLPCLVLDLGDEDPEPFGDAEGESDAWEKRRVQVDVMTMVDGGEKDAIVRARAVMHAARAAIFGAGAMGLPLEGVRHVGTKRTDSATEKGLAVGFHSAFQVTFTSSQASPAEFV